MTRVKICGCTARADVSAAVEAGADAIGLVCDVPVASPRAVPPATAAALAAAIPPFVTATLVTMPSSVEHAVRLADSVQPGAVQIHDPERLGGPEALGALRRRLPVPALAAVSLAGADGIDRALTLAAHADGLLVDPGTTDGGGTGRHADWDRAAALRDRTDVPLILAGGLDPATVGRAIETVRPFGVDVATGVERDDPAGDDRPGRKDPDAVAAFVDTATRAGRARLPGEAAE
jgi:phosphoribosylanthranilate isomerase